MVDREKTQKLNVTLSITQPDGLSISISAVCGAWAEVEKFKSDFEDTLLKGDKDRAKNHGKCQ